MVLFAAESVSQRRSWDIEKFEVDNAGVVLEMSFRFVDCMSVMQHEKKKQY